ncbi:PepSY domain-containing protein [Metabacillus sp. GX 13764]|uniref:PepSY domain-containing protein n=1 Tax=Metabacillus kandeliae TaxID=2900151 RepID=UPI001E5B7800|nr:PepSY domain-containing protein [Metabacillus kandeliae]MCD7035412.1 PepSY domain-containing protein [Metabacillus kandeliae]
MKRLFKLTAPLLLSATMLLLPVQAHAASGHQIAQEPKLEKEQPVKKMLTMEQAMAIALKQVPGKVVKVVFKMKENKPAVYKFVIVADGKKHKVRIDAATGKVLKVKKKDGAGGGE